MINCYMRTITFQIENIELSRSFKVLMSDKEVSTNEIIIAKGNTFNKLYKILNKKGFIYDLLSLILIEIKPYKSIFTKKRKIKFKSYLNEYNKTFTDNDKKLKWKISIIEEPCEVLLEELSKFDINKVIQYCKERGLNNY